MALRVSIIPLQKAFFPGDPLTARIEVANHSDTQSAEPFSIQVGELTIKCIGQERVDRTWVSSSYGSDVPPAEKVNRRETRTILQSISVRLGANFRLDPGQERSWNIKSQLPQNAPPSFRGTAVKYTYLLVAGIRFSASPLAMQLLTQHLSLDLSRRRGSLRGGSLLTLSSPSLPKPGKGKQAPQSTPSEHTAEAKTPVLVLPLQHFQGELAERGGRGGAASVVTGEESELQAVEYSLHPGPLLPLEVVEIRGMAAAAAARLGRSLPRGISLSRSDLQAQPEGSLPIISPLKPIDAWPETTATLPEPPADPPTTSAAAAEGFASPLPPPTPMTGGDSVYRSFNLRLADRLLVSVVLETEEMVQSPFSSSAAVGIRKVQDEHQQLTPNTLLTHFMLSVPPDAPASFASHLVALRWVLRFEFTTSRRQAGGSWLLGSSGTATESLTWSLPVLVQPAR